MSETIRPRDRDAILQALSAGVVPRVGLRHIQVGRASEVQALLRDIDRVADGGAAFRLIVGEYGAGKTFFLNLTRMIALERRCVSVHADLAPDRRLHATGGQARALYSEAIRNMATRTKPEGQALASIVERFVTDSVKQAAENGRAVESVIDQRLAEVQENLGGYDFANVLKAYWRGNEDGDETLKTSALRWLRGEYATRTDARQALGVRTIIDDSNIYDALKTLSVLVRLAGYGGLIVVFDELVNLYKLQSAQARNQNFEQILRILNDVLQGQAPAFGVLLGGTPEFLLDTRRGLFSYPALQSRLSENNFAAEGRIDLSGPVIRLQNLTPEDLHVLLENIRNVCAGGDPAKHLVPDEALAGFMDHCNRRIGEAYFRTPRNTVRAFVQMLAVVEQNPGTSWQSLLTEVAVAPDAGDATEPTDGASEGADDELTRLQL